MQKVGIIFDHDGTLVDSIEAVVFCTNKVITPYGAEAASEELIRQGMALPTFERFVFHSQITDPEIVETMCRDFYKYMNAEGVPYVKLYDGITDSLEHLVERNFSLGLVSNNQGIFVRRVAAELKYAYDFEVILGEENVPAPKPDGRGILQACAGMGSDPNRSWYIGDGKPDFEAARNAGLKCGLVTWGAHPREELEALKPDAIFHSPSELAKFKF